MARKRMFALEQPDGTKTFEVKGHLQIGTDVKLVDGQPNVSSTVSIPEPKVVFKEAPPEKPLNPEETILESERILDTVRHLDANPMTIGDLSVVTSQKKRPEIVRQQLRNLKGNLSIGDLSIISDRRESIEARVDADLATKDESLTVGDLYRGQRPNDFAPSTSESQELYVERIKKHKERVAEELRVRGLMAGCRDEKLEEYADKYLSNKASESNEPKDKA